MRATEVVDALVTCLQFIAESPEDVVDLDSSVQVLEDVAFRLQRLPAPEKAAFLDAVAGLAGQERDEARRTFLLALPHNLGLIEES